LTELIDPNLSMGNAVGSKTEVVCMGKDAERETRTVNANAVFKSEVSCTQRGNACSVKDEGCERLRSLNSHTIHIQSPCTCFALFIVLVHAYFHKHNLQHNQH